MEKITSISFFKKNSCRLNFIVNIVEGAEGLNTAGPRSKKKEEDDEKSCCRILPKYRVSLLAYYGMSINVNYMNTRLNKGIATTSKNINNYSGTCYDTSLLGAFVADGYWHRYWIITIFMIIYTIMIMKMTIVQYLPKYASATKAPSNDDFHRFLIEIKRPLIYTIDYRILIRKKYMQKQAKHFTYTMHQTENNAMTNEICRVKSLPFLFIIFPTREAAYIREGADGGCRVHFADPCRGVSRRCFSRVSRKVDSPPPCMSISIFISLPFLLP
ncbi:Peptide transporter PTR1 [Platanthera guangdongensis]|uniref:Peptide transporter PTR1 n=1 Tax=Platanthera guangdongensis TaxID=2320717 RepID=A0ABR2LZ73_9ASPA